MTAPISGPYYAEYGSKTDSAGSYRIQRTRYRQRRPYDKPAPYRYIKTVTLNALSTDGAFHGSANAWTGKSPWQSYAYPCNKDTPEVAAALSIARGRFVSKLGDPSGWAVTLAQRAQAMNMITARAIQLYRFAVLLRQGKVDLALKHLRAHVPQGLRAKSRSFAGLFLELHFGWSPLFQDIFNSVKLLESDPPVGKIRGHCRLPIQWQGGSKLPGADWAWFWKHTGYAVTYFQSGVVVENPNLFLASQLGLTNPAAVAWDLVPFSFIVDWVANVEQFLTQWSDFHGIRLIDPHFGFKAQVQTHSVYTITHRGRETYRRVVDSSCISTERILGVPEVKLGIRRGFRLSPSRGLTAISLLLQKGLRGG